MTPAGTFPPPVPDEAARLRSVAGLIRLTALPYARKMPDHAEDLYQEAWIGGLRAVRTYDPRKSALTTWTIVRVRAACIEYCRRSPLFRVSREAQRWPTRLLRLGFDLDACRADPTTCGAAARAIGVDPAALAEALVEDFRARSRVSLDAAAAAGVEAVAPPEPDPTERWDMERVLAGLSDRQRSTLRLRMEGWPFQAIGREWGVSHQTVRNDYRNGLAKAQAAAAEAMR